jgi:hypothetical protein
VKVTRYFAQDYAIGLSQYYLPSIANEVALVIFFSANVEKRPRAAEIGSG